MGWSRRRWGGAWKVEGSFFFGVENWRGGGNQERKEGLWKRKEMKQKSDEGRKFGKGKRQQNVNAQYIHIEFENFKY